MVMSSFPCKFSDLKELSSDVNECEFSKSQEYLMVLATVIFQSAV